MTPATRSAMAPYESVGRTAPDDHETFYTLALLYSDDEGIEDSDTVEQNILAALTEAYPEYA
jgi:hypothetical protein